MNVTKEHRDLIDKCWEFYETFKIVNGYYPTHIVINRSDLFAAGIDYEKVITCFGMTIKVLDK